MTTYWRYQLAAVFTSQAITALSVIAVTRGWFG